MNPRVTEVLTEKNFTLVLKFENGEKKIFDVKPFLGKGIFKELADWSQFATAKVFMGTVSWKNGQDFCPDSLYLDSKNYE